MSFVDLLRKLGIVRWGAVKGTYRDARGRPIELQMDGVFNADKDLVGGGGARSAPAPQPGSNVTPPAPAAAPLSAAAPEPTPAVAPGPAPITAGESHSPVCPTCGLVYPPGSKFCKRDGAKLVAAGAVAAQAPYEATAQATTPRGTQAPGPRPPEPEPRRSHRRAWIWALVALLVLSGAAGAGLYVRRRGTFAGGGRQEAGQGPAGDLSRGDQGNREPLPGGGPTRGAEAGAGSGGCTERICIDVSALRLSAASAAPGQDVRCTASYTFFQRDRSDEPAEVELTVRIEGARRPLASRRTRVSSGAHTLDLAFSVPARIAAGRHTVTVSVRRKRTAGSADAVLEILDRS